jgi:4-phospho-D-threonate 3-dehydrogenase / 4-phospho-D-erythronate 3-dehydrogenase
LKNKKKIAISVGDINGIGLQLILENHKKISLICNPIYCINQNLLTQASKLLNIKIPKDFNTFNTKGKFKIKAGKVSKKSGLFSYNSFLDAINLAKDKKVDGICTMPINKESWNKANISYVGHTDMLRDIFKQDAIMMLGCEKMYVALFTEHIPLKEVIPNIKTKKITYFLLNLYKSLSLNKNEKIAVLGVNPHSGDNGVLGDEEKSIKKAINKANKILNNNIFEGTIVPDIAFTPNLRKKYKYFLAMYHDQGLAPLKALYFDEGINISLNLPVIRTSVDHGTAFDIAYKKNNNLSNKSYINAIKYILK